MPTRLYFAPAAEGKTAYAVQLARQQAAALTADVRVCVSTSLQAHAFRERLARAGGALGVRILTFDELVTACLNSAGEAFTELSDAVQYRLLRTIIDRLPLDHFAPLKSKPGFIQLLQEMITELKFAQIEPPAFQVAAVELGSEPRLTELAVIYQSYQERLQAREWADRVGLYWLAAESLAGRAADIGRNWSLFIVDGFDDFTPIQLTLLRLLADRAAETVITITESATVNYPRYQRTRREVEEALGVTAQPLPADGSENGRHRILGQLAHNLFTQTTELATDNRQTVEMVEAADRTAEVRAALRWLKARLVQDGFRLNEVALLSRNTAPYRPFIRQIAAEFSLPVRFVDGLPLAQSPLIAALLNLLRLNLPTERSGGTPGSPGNEPELARRAVVSAWRCPYFSLGFIAAGDADALDNIGRHQRVIRGLGQWQAAFEAQINATQQAESDEEAPIPRLPAGSAAGRLQEKFSRFLTIIRPPAQAATMRDFVGWLERLIGPDPAAFGRYSPPEQSLQITAQARQNAETEAADIAALQTLKDILRGFVWAEEALGQSRVVDYSYFFNELNGAISSAHYCPPIRSGTAEIVVADAARVRGLPFRAVAIMGLSEGEFPAVVGEDPFLRDADRQALREEFGFRLEPSTQSAEREFFYEAVARPSDRLLLTRPTLADNGASWPPSPFWEAVHKLIGSPRLARPISGESLIALESAASWPEYWQSLAEMSFPAERVFQPETWQQITQAAEILQSRQQVTTTGFDGFLPQLAGQMGRDYGPDHTWSASRLETYQRCGFFFYIQNVLGLQARPEPAEGLDVTQLGSVYHRMFEAVYKAGLPEQLDDTGVRAFVKRVATPILDAAPQKEGFRETPWWSQTRQEMIEHVTASILALEAGDFTFFQSEAAFGFNELPQLVLETAAGPLHLRGFIDRIDRDAHGRLRIIDYKLGGPGQFSKRAFSEGKKLQLPLYALAAQETLGLGPVAEGFYWHFRTGEKSWFTLSLADGGPEGAIETAVNYAAQAVGQIRSGRFTPKAPDGGCPAYCPAAAFCWHYTPQGW